MNNLDNYIKTAEEALVALLKEWRPRLMENTGIISFDLKADKSVVTKLDRELELAIKDLLRPLTPEVGFMGEEHGLEGSTDMYWTVDPIDGTESFIRGYPVARTQLALVMDGQAEYAFCYQFPMDNLYTARRGQGTTKNGQKISVAYKPLERCWIDLSLNMFEPEQYDDAKRLSAEIADIAVAHNYLLTVDGVMDGLISSFNGGPWDYVPRALLMTEAGLRVGNYGSMDYDPNIMSLVCAHPNNFEAIQKLLSPQA